METNKINTFDSLFTTDHIRMLKILLSYIKPPLQGKLAILIRFLELSYTWDFFSQNPYAGWSSAGLSLFAAGSVSPFSFDGLSKLLDEVWPFCDYEEREKIQSFQNTYQNMENIRQTMEMFEMMQEIMPDFFTNQPENQSGDNTDNTNSPFGMDLSGLSQMLDMIRELQNSNIT